MERDMFDFRIINTEDGNQIIDRKLKTTYSSLTPIQMLEYAEMEDRLGYIKSCPQWKRG